MAMRLGKKIADRRKQLEWTQAQVAERVGVDAETISRFERGINLPSLPTLESLAAALSQPIGVLLSEQSSEIANETAVFNAWISDIPSGDRAFVMTILRSCCDYIGSRSK